MGSHHVRTVLVSAHVNKDDRARSRGRTHRLHRIPTQPPCLAWAMDTKSYPRLLRCVSLFLFFFSTSSSVCFFSFFVAFKKFFIGVVASETVCDAMAPLSLRAPSSEREKQLLYSLPLVCTESPFKRRASSFPFPPLQASRAHLSFFFTHTRLASSSPFSPLPYARPLATFVHKKTKSNASRTRASLYRLTSRRAPRAATRWT